MGLALLPDGQDLGVILFLIVVCGAIAAGTGSGIRWAVRRLRRA